jgi:DNA-binding NarL/FixJ family response regulator
MDTPADRAIERVGPRVLVVDDDLVLGEALCDLLRQKGFDVVGQARTGPEAVALSRTSAPDVVLMDFRMPMMDGLQATTLIQEHSPTTQAVMFTAYDDETLKLEASETGVYCVLVKGCNPNLIVDMVTRAAERKWQLEARRAPG